jgi:hypothetical protein
MSVVRLGPCDNFAPAPKFRQFKNWAVPAIQILGSGVPLTEHLNFEMFSIFKLGHCEIQIRPLRVKVGQHPRKGAQVRAFGPAGLRRRVLLCLLLCAVCWRCSSSRYFWSGPENLAVQRCSNLLSRSRGMLLITKAPGLPSPRGFKGLNARDPLKVHHNGSWALGSLTRNQRLAPGAMAGNDRHMTACIANAPMRQAFPSARVNYDT